MVPVASVPCASGASAIALPVVVWGMGATVREVAEVHDGRPAVELPRSHWSSDGDHLPSPSLELDDTNRG